MSSNGSRVEQMRMQQQEKEKQRNHQEQMTKKEAALRKAFNADGEDSDAIIEQLLSSEDLEAGGPGTLQEPTVAKIKNLMSRDWVVANLTDAQEHDIRHKLEVLKLKVIGMHPPQESAVEGELRAYLLDDRDERLRPLTAEERVLIDELFETLKARITRGRQGFERELMRTNIARSETAVEDEDDDGGYGLL
jgi:hypothetical protein